MNFITTFNQIFTLFSLIIVGYVANKKGLITKNLNKELSNIVLYIALPALVIKSMQYNFSSDMLGKSIKMIGISICIYIGAIIFSYAIIKLLKLKGKTKDVIQFLLIFPNVGFMGYPVINSIYGDVGVFYTALFNMPFDILIWTFGIMLMCRNSTNETKINIKKIFLNPGLPSIAIGYTLFLLSIKIPKPIYDTLNILGNSTTPMSMILVGSILAQSKIEDALKNKKLIIISILRLLVIPFIVYVVLKDIFYLKGLLLGIPFIIFSMPSAANAAIFATRYDNDYILASQGIFITTLLSIITIPILIAVLKV